MPDDIIVGYVPQVIENFELLSGGERPIQALKEALKLDPQLLLR